MSDDFDSFLQENSAPPDANIKSPESNAIPNHDGGDDDPFAAHIETSTPVKADLDAPAAAATGPVDDGTTFDDPFPEVTQQREQLLEQKQADEGPTPLQLWEQERDKLLAERREQASKEKQQFLQQAQEESKKFYSDRDDKLEKTKKANRAEERQNRTEIKALFESGSQWEKVAKLVNLQPKVADKNAASRIDRMRKLLIQLKATKDSEWKRDN